jgi:hypothetical protein
LLASTTRLPAAQVNTQDMLADLKINRGNRLLQQSLTQPQAEVWLVFASIVVYFLFFVFMRFGLEHDFMTGDPGTYWKHSFDLSAPFSTWWVPGYPFVIALVRTLSFNQLPPVMVLMIVSATFYAVQILAVYWLLRELNVISAMWVALLFAVFPLVGLTYTVRPYADGMATALLVLAFLYFLKGKWSAFSLLLSMTMLTHKATWLFLCPLMLIAFFRHKQARVPIILACVPLAILIVAGAFYHKDLLWFMRWSVENLFVSQSSLPVLDGVVNSLLSANTGKKLKGVIILTILLNAFYFLYRAWRSQFWLGLAISCGVVAMGLVLNQYEVFAVVRFGKVMIIPAAYFLLSSSQNSITQNLIKERVSFVSMFIASVLSNVAFAYYASKFHVEQ